MTERTDHDVATSTDQESGGDGGAVAARRALLTKGGVAAAAAAVAGLGVSGRAQADDDDPLTIGQNNTGSSTTGLQGSTLLVGGGNDDAAIIGTEQGKDGVHGRTETGTGVLGSASRAGGVGVYGINNNSTQAGTGIVGESTLGTAIIGRGEVHDVEADGSGRVALLEPGQSGSASDTGVTGTIARDTDGNLWYCHSSDQWQRLGGPAAGGAFHPIDPVRVFDSRIDAYPENGPLDPNASKTISVADGRDAAGSITAADAIPEGATAIAYNVTVTGTTGPNFVSVTPGDAADFTTSTINWSGSGESLANGAIVKLDDMRQVKLFGGDQTGSTDVIVDVSGYFL